MTRAPGELLRDVAKALAGYASLKHTQSKFPQHPGIQAALLEEVAYIEALEREVRNAARAQAGRGEELTAADVLDEAYEQFTGTFIVRYPFVPDDQHFMVPHDAAEKFTQEMEQGIAAFRVAIAQAQAGAGEGQGEGA